jgi:hypothetical protein
MTEKVEADAVDQAAEEWAKAGSDLDVPPDDMLARVHRMGRLLDEVPVPQLRYVPGIDNLGDFEC